MTQTHPQQFPFARQSAGHAPPRLPGSIRRTTSIDSDWPEGQGRSWVMSGSARDLLTPFEGAPVELATGSYRLVCSPQREIIELETTPAHPRARDLVGVRATGASRTALDAALGDVHGTPLYQLLDDFAGASLVAGWIWLQWSDPTTLAERRQADAKRRARMVDICTGFAAGGSSLRDPDGPDGVAPSSTRVGPLENPDDPLGWHVMPAQKGPQVRRARRIDVWREEGVLQIDAGFQDSGSTRDGGRIAIHEYRVHAEVDAAGGQLIALQAQPLILPFRECPGASVKATRMIGQQVAEFRTAVIETLPSTMGCTHLNDVLRALADVPALARMLPANR